MYYAGDKRDKDTGGYDLEPSGRLLYSLSLLPLKGKSILVVGDSYGWFASNALMAGAKEVHSFDIASPDSQISILKKKYKNFSHQKLSVLDFKLNKKYDLAIFLEVIEHLPTNTESVALKNISNHLKPDGKILLSTPYKSNLSYLGDPAALFGHRHYNLEDLTLLFTKAGLSIVNFERGGYVYTVVDLLLLYFNKWILRRKYKSALSKQMNTEYPHPKGVTVFLVCQKY